MEWMMWNEIEDNEGDRGSRGRDDRWGWRKKGNENGDRKGRIERELRMKAGNN
ncbi:hypothetical protein [Bacillus altitudinis]|uniref:hypothetical protein n=1 Tax=Bacillus altitudinis TaxID=293387 RepID=UPI0016438687|nr:hypothetical protein [Bacillus altitudinis]